MRPTYVVSLGNPYVWPNLTGFEPGDAPDDLLPLDALRNLTRIMPQEPGIYFMWRGPQLLYIGSSMEDLDNRIFVHKRAQVGAREGHRRFPFTHFTCMEHALDGLQDLEYRYIQAYKPPFNRRLKNTGFDNRVPLTRGSPTAGEKHE